MKILSTNSVIIDYTPGFNGAVIMLIICAVLDLFCVFLQIKNKKPFWIAFGIFATILCTFSAILNYRIGGDPIYTNEYEILCDEDYVFDQDFLKTHTLVEQHKKVWTWRENETYIGED